MTDKDKNIIYIDYDREVVLNGQYSPKKILETIQESCADYHEHCCDCMLYAPDSKYCALNIEELGGFPFYWDLDKFFDKEQYHDDDN